MPRELQNSLVEAGISPASADELADMILHKVGSNIVVGRNQEIYNVSLDPFQGLADPTTSDANVAVYFNGYDAVTGAAARDVAMDIEITQTFPAGDFTYTVWRTAAGAAISIQPWVAA